MVKQITQKCRVIIILIILLIFQSCLYSHMTHLTDEDLEWISCYEDGDTVLFLSNHGNIDTIIITDMGIRDRYNRFIPDEAQSSTFEASAWYKFIISNKFSQNDELSGTLYLENDYESDTLLFSSRLIRRFAFDVNSFNRSSDQFKVIFSKFSTIDSIPDNYLMFDDSNSHWSEIEWKNLKIITHFVFNKSLGLIYYRYEDGEEFTLQYE